MNFIITELINDLKAHRRSYIDCNPIFARLAGGDLTRFHYLAYLRETYHLVKHTAKYLTIAANRVAENDERLSAYFRKFCLEETGHELLCIRDIDALRENADMIISGESRGMGNRNSVLLLGNPRQPGRAPRRRICD